MSAPTYEDILDFHGLSDRDVESECSEDFLFSLSKKLVRWQIVDLQLDRSVVASIASDRTMEDEGKRQQLLERWKEKFGHQATHGRLVRSFIKSDMANLADFVCKELKEMNTRPSSVTGTSWKKETFITHPLPSVPEEQRKEGKRNINEYPTTVTSSHPPPSKSNIGLAHQVSTEQELSHSQGTSDMVTPQTTVASNNNRGSTAAAVTTGAKMDTLQQLTSLLTARDQDVRRKKEKVKELKCRKKTLESYLIEKDTKIGRLEADMQNMQISLYQEKMKQKEAQKILEEKEDKITELQGTVDKRELELQEEKENKKEKCEQLEQVETSLTSATAAKEKAEAQLTGLSETLDSLQCQVDRAEREVEISRKEREKIIRVLEWTDDDLVEEEDELKEISELLVKRRIWIKYTILIFLFITVILAGALIEVWRRSKSC